MERISDLKDIASLLREVESGGATGKALQKLALFPDIRRKRKNLFNQKQTTEKNVHCQPLKQGLGKNIVSKSQVSHRNLFVFQRLRNPRNEGELSSLEF